jgi:hypothetical protein
MIADLSSPEPLISTPHRQRSFAHASASSDLSLALYPARFYGLNLFLAFSSSPGACAAARIDP